MISGHKPAPRVLLINPPFVMPVAAKTPYPPLGLAYLAACLERDGCTVAVLDAYVEGADHVAQYNGQCVVGLQDAELATRISEFRPDIVGLSYNFTHFHDPRFDTARVAKEAAPKALVVCGGHHVTMDWARAIENPFVDMVVLGEGEETLVEIAQRWNEGKERTDIPGTIAKRNGAMTDNGFRPPVADIDKLPLPAYHLLRMDLYLTDQRKNLFPFAMREPIGFLIASRGCPYHCIFCSTSKVFKKFRARNPERVVEEITLLMTQYGVREIAFQDDCFLGNLGAVERLCRILVEKKLRIKWTVPPGLPVWRVKPELLRLMRDAGFYRACFPIETGCPETLRFIRKPVDLDGALATVAQANRLGLWTYGNLVLGFPDETPAQVEESVRYFMRSGLDMLSVYICQPHAGSELYTEYLRLGLLKEGPRAGSNIFETRYDTRHFTAAELNRLRGRVLSDFMRMRIRSLFTWHGLRAHLLNKIRSFEDFRYLLHIARHVIVQSIRRKALRYF
ncbi:MAG: radical SAM protein [Fibrobacterota bacterium]